MADQTATPAKPDEPAKKVTVIYMPLPGDSDETVVAGIPFKAYEPVEVPGGLAFLGDKLNTNPWFTSGEVNADRKAAWKKARDAQAAAKKAKLEAEKVEAEALAAK